MSLEALSWAWKYEDLEPTEKLVLLALADCHNEGTGLCFPSMRTIAKRACCGVSTARRHVANLEERGLVARVKSYHDDGRQRSNEFRLALDPPPDMSGYPPVRERGEALAGERGDPPVRERPLKRTGSKEREEVTSPGGIKLGKVDGQRVSPEELSLAVAVLAAWNATANQSLSSPEWLRKIVLRIREHPELDVDAHAGVIRSALADPWWRGPASPSVVYGSGAVFEKALLVAHTPSAGDQARAAFDRVLARAGR